MVQAVGSVLAALCAASFASAQMSSQAQTYNLIEFGNVGFAGTFTNVKKISNAEKDSCSCTVGDAEWFSGDNAPLSAAVSVHFRGPLSLSKFAYYTSPSFTINDSSSESWSRDAYYDASSQTAENVTFLTAAGDSSPCLGDALTYASENGTGAADDSTILESDNLLASDGEFSIFSNISCPDSGYGKGCGVYRSGIPAYYGFEGDTKMFLFEFKMPTATEENSTSIEYYDMPAIWLLNDHIPRTSQYPTNSNCSCWASGCGEFDIFEVMNGTENNNLYSTFHTFQGIEDLEIGIQASGYIERDTSATMMGGVIFDSSGNTVVFMSNDTVFDSSIDYSTINSLISGIDADETYSTELATISATASSSTSKSGAAFVLKPSAGAIHYLILSAVMSAINLVL
ncbi:unnamed protein product [Kluyveromyces dobzhanskii CBS 2104]|uniref:glucan endo-1,3-beta-D-glucosidase n=1 Tax=Kluyveromyces dobzhanskii CBS 2104 TaxID=1427455 RepID=A0A0A8L130_9SACH|nr:unnamed protein product [Kluyveromyces dobzhanskii CBS 2104]